MKKLLLVLSFILLSSSFAIADGVLIPDKLSIKQGMLINWKDPQGGVKNLSTVTVAETKPVESWGKWNALWDGWTLDAGFAYDATGFNTGALLVGRQFGTLGKYLPINFPMKDKIQVTIYPTGIEIDDLFGQPKTHGASGLGIIKFDISW